MSQAEHIAMMKIADRVKALEDQMTELRALFVRLENAVNALGKNPMTAGKPKVA